MPESHRRRKQPEQVRQNLLNQARLIAASRGISAVTLQEVATAAGVTKGGLIHHFPSKQTLIDAMFSDGLSRLDQEIDSSIAAEARTKGCFTRAYIKSMLTGDTFGPGGAWSALAIGMLMEPSLRVQWGNWLHDRLEKHRETDASPALEIARLAADGAWLAYMVQAGQPNLPKILNDLQSMTQTDGLLGMRS